MSALTLERSGPAMATAILSAGEADDLAVKAARGAGLAWGVAEEAGFAVRWLHARGLDGLRALATHLRLAGNDEAGDGATHGVASALALGIALSDRGIDASAGTALGRVRDPLLLLPFLHDLARDAGPLRLRWTGHGALIAPDGTLRGDVLALARAGEIAPVLSCTDGACAAPGDAPAFAPGPPPATDPATHRALDALAMRTTVPATAASRAGAGSDRSDND